VGTRQTSNDLFPLLPLVSNQFVSPASGDPAPLRIPELGIRVSNQFVSPASGDAVVVDTIHTRQFLFPINLFPQRVGTSRSFEALLTGEPSFQSICFPSEWGHYERDTSIDGSHEFPINLFPQRVGTGGKIPLNINLRGIVSNQFVSPASGDPKR